MEKWFRACIVLCLVGYFGHIKPNEAFGVEYLIGPWHNFTYEEVVQMIYPVWTYSMVPLLAVSFLITDYLLYKPVLIGGLITVIIYYSIYSFGHGITVIQISEFFCACGTVFGLVYYSYIYAQIPRDKFQVVTGYTHAAYLAGSGTGQVLGQILISTGVCDYSTINYVSLGSVAIATVIAFFLPSAKESVYFHRRNSEAPSVSNILKDAEESSRSSASPWRVMWTDFVDTFTNPYLLKWSLWYTFATAFYIMAYTYVQVLWAMLDAPMSLNGAVEATQTFLSVVAVFAIGYVRIDWSKYGEIVMGLVAFFEAIMIFLMVFIENLWVNYTTYVLFQVAYRIAATIANSEVAKGLKEESYGLVLGVLSFSAVSLEALLTVAIVDDVGLALGTKQQYVVYGCCYTVMSSIFFVVASYRCGKNR